MKFVLRLSLIPLAVVASPTQERNGLAPLHVPSGDPITGSYIVKFRDGIAASSMSDQLQSVISSADHIYSDLFQGFAGKLDAKTLRDLRRNANVEYIQQDSIVTINGYVDQNEAGWNLGRISHRKPGSKTYTYHDSAGEGTCAYVLDTGVDGTHKDFGGRAQQIKSFYNTTTDENGHGTHVSGVIGSATYGVAKKTTIYGVQVLDKNGSGSYSNIIAGMEFVASDSANRSCPKGVVANLSIGGGFNAAVNQAAAALVKKNVFVSVSAGSSNSDAKNFSPASEPTVCTAASLDQTDSRPSNSNYGSVVDIFAPAQTIRSTWLNGENKVISGTSAAAAHITGLGAYLAGLEGFPGSEALCERIQELATEGIMKNVPEGTVNLIAFNGNPSG